MSIRLLILFIGLPALEIYTLVKADEIIGLTATVMLVLATGIAGAYLAKSQGLAILNALQSEMQQGRLPSTQLLDGFLVLIGGILLLTPGFWTDSLGFVLLLPNGRQQLSRLLRRWLEQKIERGEFRVYRS